MTGLDTSNPRYYKVFPKGGSMTLPTRGHRVLAGAVVLLLLAGCATATPERVAYNSLATIAKTVDTAMAVAGDLYREGRAPDSTGAWVVVDASKVRITDEQKAKILDLFATYQKAALTAAEALKAWTATKQGSYEAALEPVQAAMWNLKAFISALSGRPA